MISGFGVRPVRYSEIKYSITLVLYSALASRVINGIWRCAATRIASRLSVAHVQGIPGGYQPLMKTPVTRAPPRRRSAADTAESTPPESPTKTFFPRRSYLTGNDIVAIISEQVQKRKEGDLLSGSSYTSIPSVIVVTVKWHYDRVSGIELHQLEHPDRKKRLDPGEYFFFVRYIDGHAALVEDEKWVIEEASLRTLERIDSIAKVVDENGGSYFT